MMTATPEQNFMAGINSSLIVVGLIAAAVALLLGLILTRQILKPVRDLTIGATRIASGDLKFRVAVESRDEIGRLAQSFNSMASTLEQAEESKRQSMLILLMNCAHRSRLSKALLTALSTVFSSRKRKGLIRSKSRLLAYQVDR